MGLWFSWAALVLLFAALAADIFDLLPDLVCMAMLVPALAVFAVNEWRAG